MEFVKLSVVDSIQPAVTVAKLHVMAISLVLLVRNPAKSAATIRDAASYVMSLAHHVLRIVLGLVHIAVDARYHVQYPVICCHAQSVVQRS